MDNNIIQIKNSTSKDFNGNSKIPEHTPLYRINRIQSDGNCAFRAISYYLLGDENDFL